MKISFVSLGVLLLVTACSPVKYDRLNRGLTPVDNPVAVHSHSFAAAATDGIDLRMRDGALKISVSGDDSIRARVALGPHPDRDYRRYCGAAIAEAATIATRQVARTTEIRIDSKDRLVCAEQWTIEVPARMDVVVEGDVANILVDGIKGDVIATVDVGSVSIRGSGASAVARVRSVGNATAESGSSNYSEARAKASVGETELLIDGRRVDVKQSPGAGGRIALKGSGQDRIVAETGVGDARVMIIRNPNATSR